MATIAVMIGGAILNATTFIGGSYLAKYFSGDVVRSLRVGIVTDFTKAPKLAQM